jgi:hypothetical protein
VSVNSGRKPLSCATILPGALTGLFLALGITQQSLWIDESYVAWIVARDDPLSMYHDAITRQLGEPLMPFYILGQFFWTKAFGNSELVLRLANLPFAVLFAAAVTVLSVHLGRRWVCLPLLVSPFLVFYMNEARPYLAVISLAAVATVALLLYAEGQGPPRALVALCLASCALVFGMHLYTAFFLGSLVLFAAFEMLGSPAQRQRWRRHWLKPVLVSLPFFLLVAVYYAASFLAGSRGLKRPPSWKNLAFSCYEQVGFAGLGPPRNDLRAERSWHALAPYAPFLVPALLVLLLCAWVLWFSPPDPDLFKRRRERHLLLAGVLGIALAAVTAFLLQFNLLGRHLAAFFSLFACWFLLRLRSYAAAPVLPWRVTLALALLGIVWVVSDLRLLLLPDYGKDDYRAAANFAFEAPVSVFWCADHIAGRYYGISALGEPGELSAECALSMRAPWPVRRKALVFDQWTEQQLTDTLRRETLHADAFAILSKPDLHDPLGTWAKVLPQFQAEMIARLAAFEIWRIPRGSNSRPH